METLQVSQVWLCRERATRFGRGRSKSLGSKHTTGCQGCRGSCSPHWRGMIWNATMGAQLLKLRQHCPWLISGRSPAIPWVGTVLWPLAWRTPIGHLAELLRLSVKTAYSGWVCGPKDLELWLKKHVLAMFFRLSHLIPAYTCDTVACQVYICLGLRTHLQSHEGPLGTEGFQFLPR